jgi:hypothetical protein
MFKTGKLPARPDAIKLKFGAYYKETELPPPPLVIGRFNLFPQQWGMLGNSDYGDCVFAGADHETMLLAAYAGHPVPPFTDGTALTDYAAVTGFKVTDPSTDNGTDVQAAASYRQKTGIVDAHGNRYKTGIYAALRVGDLNEIAQAVYLFGCCGIGVNLPSSAEDQFNAGEPWSIVPHDTADGGHYIPCVGRNSRGNFLIVTWGRLQAVEPAWLQANMDEGIVYVPSTSAPQALLDDFKQVTA